MLNHKVSKASALVEVKRLVGELCASVNTPRSLAVWLLFSNNEHNQLVNLTCEPDHYSDPHLFADDYLVTQMLSKADFLQLDIDRKAVAIEKFLQAEQKCAETNRRLASDIPTGRVRNVVSYAKNYIERLIGELDRESLDIVFSRTSWGPGVTSSIKDSFLSVNEKLQARLDATPALIAAGGHFVVNTIPAWSKFHTPSAEGPVSILRSALHPLPGNAVTFVPKNAKTDRSIAIEPHLNAALQRGVGRLFRDRLRYVGCDLNDQTRNQKLACKGSIDDSVCTIDLASASDTVSRAIVEMLLPDSWVSFLNTIRSCSYQLLDRPWVPYHKHSSMGNGYTFELESMIFYALSLGVCSVLKLQRDLVSVYGDDIIVPVAAAELLQEVLDVCGFETNKGKSFFRGCFRESCGKDFFKGINVRPFFIKAVPTRSTDWYVLANKIRRYSHNRNLGFGCDGRFFLAWKTCLLSVRRDERFFIPEGFGDGGFIGCFDESARGLRVNLRRKKRCLSYLEFRYIGFEAMTRRRAELISVTAALFEMEGNSNLAHSSVDRSLSTARARGRWVRRVGRVNDWPDLQWLS